MVELLDSRRKNAKVRAVVVRSLEDGKELEHVG